MNTVTKFAILKDESIFHSCMLCLNRREVAIFNFILKATLDWKKYGCDIASNDFFVKNIKIKQRALPISESSFFRAQAALLERGVIIKHQQTYYLNCPLILMTAIIYWKEVLDDNPAYKDTLWELYHTVCADFLNAKIVEEIIPMPTSDEIFSKLSIKKTPTKKIAAVPATKFTPRSLFPRFVKIFKERGITHTCMLFEWDPTVLHQELGSLKGLINWFPTNADLINCLKEIADNWLRIAQMHPEVFELYNVEIISFYANFDLILREIHRQKELDNNAIRLLRVE